MKWIENRKNLNIYKKNQKFGNTISIIFRCCHMGIWMPGSEDVFEDKYLTLNSLNIAQIDAVSMSKLRKSKIYTTTMITAET